MYSYSEYYDSILVIEIHQEFNQETTLRLATWNVNGIISEEKRLLVEQLAWRHNLDIVCVQETHLSSTRLRSPHFTWILGPQSRGCGFRLSKQLDCSPRLYVLSLNIFHLHVS